MYLEQIVSRMDWALAQALGAYQAAARLPRTGLGGAPRRAFDTQWAGAYLSACQVEPQVENLRAATWQLQQALTVAKTELGG